MKHLILLSLITSLALNACKSNHKSDAYGNFEAVETIVSAEANGSLIVLNIEEGKDVKANTIVGIVDTLDLYLQLQQLKSQRNAVAARAGNIITQIAVQNQQKETQEKELNRIKNLLQDGAATQKQYDDLSAGIALTNKQIETIKSQNNPLVNEVEALDWQIKLIQNKIKKCYILNPVEGTVLEKYVEPSEIVAFGKAIYKIANIKELDLRAYISGDQLPYISLGQKVEVLIDKDKSNNTTLEGTVSWISSQAEFTPKVIQTKEERVDQVYAVKIRVANNGALKIGMPGEINFMPSDK